MWILTLRSPAGELREFVLQPGRTTLGRDPDNDVIIADDSASRQHAELHCDRGANMIVLRDLGSLNGTLVNGLRLAQTHVLRPGDQVEIGQHLVNVARRNKTDSVATAPLAGPR